MENISPLASAGSKANIYKQIYDQLSALLAGESDLLANAANTSALLYQLIPDVNWVGFYFIRGQELIVGPFQGKSACTRIAMGKGVCGMAAAEKRTVVVSDVCQFEGHIACDPASRSEIVVPLLNWGKLLGVLDIDSPVTGRFDDEDSEGVESLVALFLSSLATNDLPDFETLASNMDT